MSMDTDIGLGGPQLVPLIILNNNQHIYRIAFAQLYQNQTKYLYCSVNVNLMKFE